MKLRAPLHWLADTPGARLLNAAAALIVALMLWRMAAVALATPIIAYANNYDFVRQSSCIGVWEDYTDRPKTAAYPERAVNRLVFDGDRKAGVCLPSSDNLFAWLVSRHRHKGDRLQLRFVGAAKLAAAAMLVLAIMLQPIKPPLRLALAATTCLAWTDIALLSYFNTLYLDASVVIFMVAAIGLTVALCGRTSPPGWWSACLAVAAVLWLGLARQQYFTFALLIGATVAAVFLIRWADPKRALGLLLACVALAATSFAWHARPNQQALHAARANLTDTFLGAVLPAAGNQAAALRIIGLPQHCGAVIGKDWYTPGLQANNPCPEIYAQRRLNLLPLFLDDPATFASPLATAIRLSRPAYLAYIGHFERPDDFKRGDIQFVVDTSLSTWLNQLPDRLYMALVLAACLLGPLALPMALLCGDGTPSETLLMAGLGGCLVFFSLVSSVFGDGFFEVARHAVGVEIGLAFVAGGAALTMLRVSETQAKRFFLRKKNQKTLADER